MTADFFLDEEHSVIFSPFSVDVMSVLSSGPNIF